MYVVVAVLFIEGDQVPVILLLDVVGNVIVPPLQMGCTSVNTEAVGWLTVTVTLSMQLLMPLLTVT